jgi:hypothetical protein
MKKILTIHLSVSLSFFNLSLAFFLFSCSFGFFFILFLPLIVCSHITYAPICNIYIYMYIYIYIHLLIFNFKISLLSTSPIMLLISTFCQQLHLFSILFCYFLLYLPIHKASFFAITFEILLDYQITFFFLILLATHFCLSPFTLSIYPSI